MVSFLWNPVTATYLPDSSLEAAVGRNVLLASLAGGDYLTFTGVSYGAGPAFSIDRNGNGIRNRDEGMPELRAHQKAGQVVEFSWPADARGWVLERSADLRPPWVPVTEARAEQPPWQSRAVPSAGSLQEFFRLRRTW